MLKDRHCDVQTDHVQIQTLTAVEQEEGKEKEIRWTFGCLLSGLMQECWINFFEGRSIVSSIGSGESSTLMQAYSNDMYDGGREGYVGKRNKKIMLWMYMMVQSCVLSQTYSNTAMEKTSRKVLYACSTLFKCGHWWEGRIHQRTGWWLCSSEDGCC